MKRAFLVAGLLLGVGLLLLTGAVTRAQTGISVTSASVDNRFPEGALFRLSAQSDSLIQQVRLLYTIQPDGSLAFGVPDFEPATTVSVSFQLGGARLYLAPGATIQYSWEMTDASGNTVTTTKETFVYDDVRFKFKVESAGNLNLYWYAGGQESAREMLQVARNTLDRMSALLGASVDFPVKVWVYDSVEDMRPALIRRSEGFEQRVITAGERVASDTVIVLGAADAFDTLRHELAHVVTAVAGEGPFGELPAWLDEGTAVYAQSSPDGFRSAVERAVERGRVLSVRSISSPPGDPDKVNLFYGQSWSLVSYLVDTHGPQKFAQIFATFKKGATIDDALTAVYGFNQDGLENAWRQSLGLPPRELPQPQGEQPGTPIPPSGQPEPAQPSEQGGGGSDVALILGLVAGVVALAAALAAGGYFLSRRLP